MEKTMKTRARDLAYGILYSLFSFSLLFALSAIVFSEMRNIPLALSLCLALSFLSAAGYWALEMLIFSQNRSAAFSVGYFGTVVLGAAMTFFVTSVVPLYYVFDTQPIISAMYMREACIRFCLFNAAALVIRLGIETYKYLRAVLGFDN